jgi:lysophospholipase L1-like esterase
MKILFYGDSITDAHRDRTADNYLSSYGFGYPSFVAGELLSKNPEQYEIINRGISGNRIVDLYARIKADVWNLQPDVLSILVGVNDVWHEINYNNGVELERFDRIYRMMLDDTLKVLPNVKIILCEPFVLDGAATTEKYEDFLQVKMYAKAVKQIAEDYNLPLVSLQETLEEAAKRSAPEFVLADGVHPAIGGAKLIADEWLKVFEKEIEK